MIVLLPTASEEIVNVPCAEPFRPTPDASVVLPWVKVTVPVAVPAPGLTAATVAVNVTAWPQTDGLTVEVTVVVLDALLTTCGEPESLPVLLEKFPLPP